MAGPQQYFLVETSEERTLIKSAKRPCEISVPTLPLSWFIAETLLAHLAVDGKLYKYEAVFHVIRFCH